MTGVPTQRIRPGAPSLVALCAIALACRQPSTPLVPAGHERDEGHGELARYSRTLVQPSDGEPDPFAEDRGPRGGYGGSTYASYTPPTWPATAMNRVPKHLEVPDLAGAIEGTITWRGTLPLRAKSACGELPALRVGTDGALGGALVFVERVARGRAMVRENRPSTVGGQVGKRGCAFYPAAQIVTPLPAPIVVTGDDRSVRVRVGARSFGLEAGGRVSIEAPSGITRIDADDDAHAAAFVVTLDSPAYAITDDRGRFRLDELAPGTYEVTVWHPPLPIVTAGKIAYGKPLVVKRTVTVTSARTAARLDVALR